jgi:hypothetical protein
MSSVPVEGYCWPLSASPGEPINFFVSAANTYILEYVRLTDLAEDGSGTPLISLGEQTAKVQEIPVMAWQDGCDWETTFQFTVPADWSSGFYAARLTSTGVTNVPLEFIVFVVKPRDKIHGDYLLLAHTLTWNAYNQWGKWDDDGNAIGSRYDDSENVVRSSFLRKNPLSSPTLATSATEGPNHHLASELWVLKWMQEEGHSVDVITDQDFHIGVPTQDQYASIILNTHPEYWTQKMVDNLKNYLAVGGSLMYLGGNGIFERVNLDNDGSTLVFHDGGPTPADRQNQFFRNLDPPQPERELLGVAFLFDGYHSENSGYEVLLPEHRFFNGTGLVFKSIIGEKGKSGGASGKEMDSSRAGDAPPGMIVNASINWHGKAGTDRGAPRSNLQVLARGLNEKYHHEPNANDDPPGEYIEGDHAAEMTYYDTEAGGFVFSVGSMTFGGSLVMDSNLQKIVNNVMRDTLLIRNKRLPCVIPYVLPLM